jgi:DNA replication and repair protein RecF
MRLRHLALAFFRRFDGFDHEFASGVTIICGDNGAGKSNLVEAAYVLATTRSPYTSSERDLISWNCPHRPSFARTIGVCDGSRHETTVELRLVEPDRRGTPLDDDNARDDHYHPSSVRRRAIIDGRPRAIGEVLGNLIAVHFWPEGVNLVAGASDGRRRFLDIALAQVDRAYVRALRRYQRAIVQRNAMLRRLREDPSLAPSLLDPWDAEASASGAVVVACRLRAIGRLNVALSALDEAAPGAAPIRVSYAPSLDCDIIDAPNGPYVKGWDDADPIITALRHSMTDALRATRRRDCAAATTLIGPHRDDFTVWAGRVDQRAYGSRGQQRTAALALKVAEARFMTEVAGESPILLFDDVMSELDPSRRAFVEALAVTADQAIITGTEAAVFSTKFRVASTGYRLYDGHLATA